MTRMLTPKAQRLSQIEGLVVQISDRARNLYESWQLLCSEAVIVVLKQGLGGSDERSGQPWMMGICFRLE